MFTRDIKKQKLKKCSNHVFKKAKNAYSRRKKNNFSSNCFLKSRVFFTNRQQVQEHFLLEKSIKVPKLARTFGVHTKKNSWTKPIQFWKEKQKNLQAKIWCQRVKQPSQRVFWRNREVVTHCRTMVKTKWELGTFMVGSSIQLVACSNQPVYSRTVPYLLVDSGRMLLPCSGTDWIQNFSIFSFFNSSFLIEMIMTSQN